VEQTRYELACELTQQLLAARPPGALFDHDQFCDYCRIAEAIERGERLEDILNMAEVVRWSEVTPWLKEKL